MHAKSTPVTHLEARGGRHTLSGAHIRNLTEADTKAFLDRLSIPLMSSWRLALGAFEDNGDLVGVLALTGTSPGMSTVHVAVVPERRCLKIATDLLQALATDHPDTVGRHLRLCQALPPQAAARLLESTGLRSPSPKT